jgi:Ca2+-binding RTX toxin-like protein
MRHSRIKPTYVLAFAVALAIAVPFGSSASSSQLPKCLDETPTLVGTPGDDFLVGTREDDVIVGLGGNDVIEGIGGIDLICGNEGNDQIDGGPDIDALDGGPGDDSLAGSESEDEFGEDPDFAVYVDTAAPVQASLVTGTATGDGTDTLVDIEGVFGSDFADTIEGDNARNYLYSGAGDDNILAGSGSDLVDGEDGNDAIDGGLDDDLVSYRFAAGPVVVNLAAGTARGAGDDTLAGVEDILGSKFADRLSGDAGVNWIWAQGGADLVSGAGGSDVLFGEKGNDALNGGSGSDKLNGGAGRDRLNGGPGRDRCTGEKKRSCP